MGCSLRCARFVNQSPPAAKVYISIDLSLQTEIAVGFVRNHDPTCAQLRSRTYSRRVSAGGPRNRFIRSICISKGNPVLRKRLMGLEETKISSIMTNRGWQESGKRARQMDLTGNGSAVRAYEYGIDAGRSLTGR